MSTQMSMDHTDAFDGSESHSTEPWLPVLLLLFVGSGCAALIYEIVWFQMLELFVGSSSVSIGVLLGTFMGGMCLGSFVLPRMISRSHHPLKVYALLEIAIGAIGLLSVGEPVCNEAKHLELARCKADTRRMLGETTLSET